MAGIRSHLQKLKETLAPMPWGKRMEHLWTYYKWIPITLLALILMASSMIPSILESRKEVLFGGMCVNLSLPDEAETALKEGLFTYFGGEDPSKQRVTLTYASIDTDTTDVQAAYAESSIIAAQISARELDYILMDNAAKDYFSNANVSTSLDTLLSPQQLDQLQDRLVYRKTADGGTVAFALDLTGTAFAAACGAVDGLYVAFPGNTDRVQHIDEFVDYLLNWK